MSFAAKSVLEPLEDRKLLSLLIDLRLEGGGKELRITEVGATVDMELWAVVSGSNPDPDPEFAEGFGSVFGRVLSTNVNGGAHLGNLSATLLPPFLGTPGTSKDLDGDTDTDLGLNPDETGKRDFFTIRSSGGITTDGGIVDGGTTSFKLGTIRFKITQLLGGDETQINFYVQPFSQDPWVPSATWREDGEAILPQVAPADFSVGAPVVLLGTKIVDRQPPQRTLPSPPALPPGGGATYDFKVQYSDDVGVDPATLDNNDVVVTFPDGSQHPAAFVSSTLSADGKTITATYRISAPGGYWDVTDNGDYHVSLNVGQIRDTAGKPVTAGSLGTFNINAPAVVYAGKTLIATGTAAANTISITKSKKFLVVTYDKVWTKFKFSALRAIKVFGLGGNDVITIGPGARAATVEGGDGNDVITGGWYNDVLNGGAGNDVLKGGLGNDLLKGGLGNDKLYGEDGNDTLDGEAGADLLAGGTGVDLADYSTRAKPLRITLDGKALDGETNEKDNVGADIENVTCGSGGDSVVGNAANNVLSGGAGNDTLVGGTGNDVLDGGTGRDSLDGGIGNDQLFALDKELDILMGGAGTDATKADKADKRKDIEALLK